MGGKISVDFMKVVGVCLAVLEFFVVFHEILQKVDFFSDFSEELLIRDSTLFLNLMEFRQFNGFMITEWFYRLMQFSS